jgi:SAM-dependent methyltransferase
MAANEVDPAKAQAFAGRMVNLMNSASLSLLISIGHQTRLFDSLAALPPSTSEDIAASAGLNERYVREWLGGMVTGRMVDYNAEARHYHLPPEHAAFLARGAGLRNLASMTQFVALMGQVEGEVVDAFRNGGGVPYSSFPRFQQLMGELSSAGFDATLVKFTLPLAPGLVDRLHAGIDVADVGCGSGHAVNVMARAFPRSRFTGIDFSEDGIAAGRAEAVQLGLGNATFVVQDAAKLDGAVQFDAITTFDSVHDQADPARMLRGIADSLRPGGVYICVDIGASSNLEENMDHPIAPFLFTVSTMHCMTVSLALGGTGLGNMWGHQKASEMLAEAGFTTVDIRRVENDVQNNYYIARKD